MDERKPDYVKYDAPDFSLVFSRKIFTNEGMYVSLSEYQDRSSFLWGGKTQNVHQHIVEIIFNDNEMYEILKKCINSITVCGLNGDQYSTHYLLKPHFNDNDKRVEFKSGEASQWVFEKFLAEMGLDWPEGYSSNVKVASQYFFKFPDDTMKLMNDWSKMKYAKKELQKIAPMIVECYRHSSLFERLPIEMLLALSAYLAPLPGLPIDEAKKIMAGELEKPKTLTQPLDKYNPQITDARSMSKQGMMAVPKNCTQIPRLDCVSALNATINMIMEGIDIKHQLISSKLENGELVLSFNSPEAMEKFRVFCEECNLNCSQIDAVEVKLSDPAEIDFFISKKCKLDPKIVRNGLDSQAGRCVVS